VIVSLQNSHCITSAPETSRDAMQCAGKKLAPTDPLEEREASPSDVGTGLRRIVHQRRQLGLRMVKLGKWLPVGCAHMGRTHPD
jgi:hypothetical protein